MIVSYLRFGNGKRGERGEEERGERQL